MKTMVLDNSSKPISNSDMSVYNILTRFCDLLVDVCAFKKNLRRYFLHSLKCDTKHYKSKRICTSSHGINEYFLSFAFHRIPLTIVNRQTVYSVHPFIIDSCSKKLLILYVFSPKYTFKGEF